MRCIKCGLIKSGAHNPSFECDDCKAFSPVIIRVWNDVEEKMSTLESIDPETHPIFRLLADTIFVTATNPQTMIFYRFCAAMIAESLKGSQEITDSQLARIVRTTRSFVPVYRVFTDLGLVKIRNEPYTRVLVFEEKLLKMARQFMVGTKVSEQLTKRLAHVYAGYVLLYILSIVARLQNDSEVSELPYGKRPQSLWVVLMFLWMNAHERKAEFTYENLRKFLARRGITSSVADTIARRLQAVDGKTTQGMIKDFEFTEDQIRFRFEDYVLSEFQRIRELERIRE